MCDERCSLLANYVGCYGDPFYLEIPDSFETYYKLITTEGRGNYKKAQKVKCRVERIYKITSQIYENIRDIWTSKSIRQGRPAGHFYGVLGNGPHDVLKSWPIEDYSIYTCPKHYFVFYGCFIEDKMVAYMEAICTNELMTVHSTMGNGKYLINGVMKFLFMEIFRLNMGKIKYFQYTNYQKEGDRLYFMRDLGITSHNNPQLLVSVAKGGL